MALSDIYSDARRCAPRDTLSRSISEKGSVDNIKARSKCMICNDNIESTKQYIGLISTACDMQIFSLCIELSPQSLTPTAPDCIKHIIMNDIEKCFVMMMQYKK